MTSTNTLSKKATRKAKVSSTAKRAAEVTSASDGAIATPRPTEDDDDVYTTESTDVSDVEVKEKEPKKSKTNSIETKTIDALKNAATSVIFMNLFTIHCTQNGVDPTLKTIMDNGAASNELLQLDPRLLVPVKTDYEAANIKVVDAISNPHHASYNNVINPVYLIHGTHEVQLEYLRSILDSNILALLKMVVPDWLQTDVAIKLNTQTDITECREAITELVLNNADNRNHHDAQAEKIRADTLPKLQKGSKVDSQKVRSSFIVYRESKGHCLNCGKSNHKSGESKSKILNKTYKISQYHHLEDYDFPVNKDSLYTLNSFYNQNIVSQLYQQIPDTTVPIPKAVESEMKYKPQKIEFNIPTELTNVDDKNYTVNIFNHPKRLNS
ncbi:hypothetical protein ACTFIW_009655 [Dictyostelium discoideum]